MTHSRQGSRAVQWCDAPWFCCLFSLPIFLSTDIELNYCSNMVCFDSIAFHSSTAFFVYYYCSIFWTLRLQFSVCCSAELINCYLLSTKNDFTTCWLCSWWSHHHPLNWTKITFWQKICYLCLRTNLTHWFKQSFVQNTADRVLWRGYLTLCEYKLRKGNGSKLNT